MGIDDSEEIENDQEPEGSWDKAKRLLDESRISEAQYAWLQLSEVDHKAALHLGGRIPDGYDTNTSTHLRTSELLSLVASLTQMEPSLKTATR